MKILDLRDSPWVDGPGRTVLDCATSLVGSTHEIIIGTFSGGQQKSSAYSAEALRRGLQVITIEEAGPLDWRIIKQVLRVIDQEGIELIHSHDFRSNLVGLVCGRLRKLPVISTVHGWIANDFKGRVYCTIDRWLLRYFDYVITVSARTRHLVHKACKSCDRLSVIPNALRLEAYVPQPSDRSFREKIGVEKDKVLIATIGRLSPEKGQLILLEAAALLSSDRSDLIFILVGIGPDQEVLERFVEERGLENSVKFCGFQSNMISVYNSVDIVVQSSYTEGMPNVMLEALLMGVPVVATNVGGTSEVVEHGRTGLLVSPGSASEIVAAISKILENVAESRQMALEGRQAVMEQFDHEVRVKRLKAVYDSFD